MNLDVLVFGGGMVGAAVALGFQRQGRSVGVVEPNMPKNIKPHSEPDLRVSAISYASQNLLTTLGAWQCLDEARIQPYDTLSVWEHPQCKTAFEAASLGLSHLGHLLENRHLQLALHKAIEKNTDNPVYWFQQGELLSALTGECAVNGQRVTAKLVVAADGGGSPLRKQIAAGETGWQYQQQVFAINIRTSEKSLKHTFQQFSPTGPMAYLPLFEQYAALVWYAETDQIATLSKMNPTQLKQQVNKSFPSLHSDFEVLRSASFPIRRNHSQRYFRDKVVLCGDAAHSINPLAGQGVNIGFKDVESLLAVDVNQDLQLQLEKYQQSRQRQNLLMMSAMDAFYWVFSNRNPLLTLGRNIGLKLADNAGPLKNSVLKKALGL